MTWITIDSGLPDDDMTVLIVDHGEVWTGYHADGKWFDCDDNECDGVTHWMDLPEPPEGV